MKKTWNISRKIWKRPVKNINPFLVAWEGRWGCKAWWGSRVARSFLKSNKRQETQASSGNGSRGRWPRGRRCGAQAIEDSIEDYRRWFDSLLPIPGDPGMECMKLMQACMQFRARHCFEHLWQTECVCVCVCLHGKWQWQVTTRCQLDASGFWRALLCHMTFAEE